MTSCEEEEEIQSGYDCISNTCTSVFETPQYLTLSDCQSTCENNGVVHGCLDSQACNYNPRATLDNNSCEYPNAGYDCEGNSTEYFVGTEVEGGIVFYVDETGQHGLVAAMEDLTDGATDPLGYGYNYKGYEWGCNGDNVNGADGQAIGTGYQNTLDIINQGCSTENGGITAAQAALNAEINGYSDWYLPSKDELKEMYNTIGNGGSEGSIGGFVDDGWSYWSSSETSSEKNNYGSWGVSFDHGSTNSLSKDHSFRVRVIRAF